MDTMQTENGAANNATSSNAGPPLIADIDRATAALKSALLQIGLILRFHRDARALGVQGYAARAPSSLQNALKDVLKEYKEACDSMESVLLRARAAAVAELVKQDPSYAPAQASKAEAGPPAPAEPSGTNTRHLEMSDSTVQGKGASNPPQPTEAVQTAGPPADQKPLQSVLAGIIDDDEMEDLFGPGTGSSTNTATSPAFAMAKTGSTGGTAAAGVSDPSAGQQDLASMLAGQPPVAGNSLGIDLLAGPQAQQSGFASGADMPGFPGAGAPSGQMDLSTLSGDDFNALLAGLGTGSGDDPLAGFTLDNFDLSSILGGTDQGMQQ